MRATACSAKPLSITHDLIGNLIFGPEVYYSEIDVKTKAVMYQNTVLTNKTSFSYHVQKQTPDNPAIFRAIGAVGGA